jgi:hypothetical protein
MQRINPSVVIAYIVAIFSVVVGVLILFGFWGVKSVPAMRYGFGIVLILMGIYRFVLVRGAYTRNMKDRD